MASKSAGRSSATIKVNVFDGSRQLLSKKTDILITILDGFKKQMFRDFKKSPSVAFAVPFHDGPGDDYTVVAFADGFTQAGFFPVKVSKLVAEAVDVMLLPKEAGFDFRPARWESIEVTHPDWMPLFKGGAATGAAAKDRYTQVMEHPGCVRGAAQHPDRDVPGNFARGRSSRLLQATDLGRNDEAGPVLRLGRPRAARPGPPRGQSGRIPARGRQRGIPPRRDRKLSRCSSAKPTCS
jgi:hypothetical protein